MSVVSSGTIHVRMRKMEEMGLVVGSSLKVDYQKLGYDITAFLGISKVRFMMND